MGIETAIMGGASIIGGLSAKSAAKKAAKAQTRAAEAAAAQQERMFNRQVELQEPFRQAGLTAKDQILYLLGIGPETSAGVKATTYDPSQTYYLADGSVFKPSSTGLDIGPNAFMGGGFNVNSEGQRLAKAGRLYTTAPGRIGAEGEYGSLAKPFGVEQFEKDPGYDFRFNEGQRALERSAAARGQLLSGSMLKGLQRFGQGLASQEYQNAFNRYQVERAARLNPLQSLMGSGQSSANTLTSAAGNLGQGLAQTELAAGQARASGYVGQANALNQAIGGFTNYMAQAPMYNAMSDFYRNQSGGGGGGGSGGYGGVMLPAYAGGRA